MSNEKWTPGKSLFTTIDDPELEAVVLKSPFVRAVNDEVNRTAAYRSEHGYPELKAEGRQP